MHARRRNIQPDAVTFSALLLACAHRDEFERVSGTSHALLMPCSGGMATRFLTAEVPTMCFEWPSVEPTIAQAEGVLMDMHLSEVAPTLATHNAFILAAAARCKVIDASS